MVAWRTILADVRRIALGFVSATPKGPIDYDLTRLSWPHFEALTFLLARAEFPDVVHIRQNDFGLDARLPVANGATARGWQAKRFTEKIHWGQCQDSLRRALAFWRPLHVTFAFPKVLSGKEQQEFQTFLIDEFPRVRVDWWDASEIQVRMRESEGGRRAAVWLFDHPEADKNALHRALAVSGELSDAAHAAERVAEVQKFMSRDPHLVYTTVAAERDGPVAPHAPETIISMEAEVDGIRVRFDASERYPGAADDAGLGGRLIFSDDEDGRRARAAFEQAAWSGGTVEISSGMHADFGPVPVGLRGLMPEEPVSGPFQISFIEGEPTSPPPIIPLLLRAGDAEIGIALAPADPPAGWDRAAAGSAGGLEIVWAMRAADTAIESSFSWHWRPGEGTATEQLLAAEAVLAAHGGAEIQLVNPTDGRVVVKATMDPPEDADTAIRELEGVRQFLGYVADVEHALGVPLEPPAQPTDEDLDVLSVLVGRLRKPSRDGTLKSVEFVLSQPPPFGGGPFVVVLEQPLYGRLFGAERYLGLERVHLPEGRIENYRGDEKAGDTVTVVPAEPPGNVQIHYLAPIDAPERATADRNGPRGASDE